MNRHDERSDPFDFVCILAFVDVRGLDPHPSFILDSSPDITETAGGNETRRLQ